MPTIDELLAKARAKLDRVRAEDLGDEVAAGAMLVDVRPIEERQRDGELEGAIVIDRNVLEWRLAPSSKDRIVDVAPQERVIVVCTDGYQSSLAAATLQRLGLHGATDLIGGYRAMIGLEDEGG
ncbi:MAG: rhodanese-like domain-containing protein [Acidimicrobiia bacterium]|nr:MAG: rhodanese-like domain-containing protein [Acidimicrobiia bacterium]